MDGPPIVNVSRCGTNGLLSAKPSVLNSTARARSSSVTPSEKSNRSRISVAYDDPEVAEDIELIRYAAQDESKRKHGLFDRVLGWVGLCRREKIPTMKRQNSGWCSPWIVPVVVLSPRKDTNKDQIREIGKCTIDTGNTQGNIVSRRFIEKILQCPKSSIQELTWAEKAGGLGVTGHKLVPEGAIYLTWYHNNSTMVFHNMRFLISDYPKIDLIIGARSCLEHGIQDVPNLMAHPDGIYSRTGVTTTVGRKDKDDEKDKLRQNKFKWNEEKGNLEVKLAEAEEEQDEDEIAALKEKLVIVTKKSDIADKSFEHCVASRKGNLVLAAKIQDELDELRGQTKLPKHSTISSTAVSHHNEGQQQLQKRNITEGEVRGS